MALATLSVCMIVRNEERMLPECLESVREVADQLIVVDTGSEDKSVDVARSFGAQVVPFQWVNDFSAARNESIRHATGEWILWLDADERLESSSVKPLQRLLVSPEQPTIYRVHIKNLQTDRKSYTLSVSHRLFSRHPRLLFSGRIHEQVHPSLKAAHGVEKSCDVVLSHLGYALPAEELAVKWERNRKLLETQVREQPHSSYAHYTLGQLYALMGEHELALAAYQRAIGIGEFTGTSRSSLLNATAEVCWQLDRLKDAEEYARQSLDVAGKQSAAHFILYRIRRAQEDVPGQIQNLQRVLDMTRIIKGGGSSDLPQDVLVPEEHLLFTLGRLYLAVPDYPAARKALQSCLELEPGNRETRESLAFALAKLGYWEELLATLSPLSGTLPDHLRDVQGIALIKLRRFREAVTHYEAWLKDQPEHEGLRRRLAGLYAKLGDNEAAEHILRPDSLPLH